MFIKVPSTTSILIGIVVALSGIGGVVASQQYFFLQVQKKEAFIRRTLDESDLIGIKALGDASTLEVNKLMNKEVAHRKIIIEGVDSNTAATIAQLEVRAIIDIIAWCMVLFLSAWAGTLNDRKQAEQEKKGVGVN
jgi:hypothetical protein